MASVGAGGGAGAVAEAHDLPPTNALMAENVPTFVPGSDKAVEAFRVYARTDEGWNSTVYKHYRAMRTNQTLSFVNRMLEKYSLSSFGVRPVTPGGAELLRSAGVSSGVDGAPDGSRGLTMSVRDMFKLLEKYVDASDPDTELPNLIHMVQTAERARAAGEPDWFVLTCLIHDMELHFEFSTAEHLAPLQGKAMFVFGGGEDGQEGTATGQQWSLGGDTFVVGAALPGSTVYPELNALNPDMAAGSVTATEEGIYTPGCGIMALKFAFGHDEYAYNLVRANGVPLPEDALAMLRLHSCYPWHRGGAYRTLMKDGDEKLLAAVLRFNQYDLYSKSDSLPDVEALWPYYQGLIDKFMPGLVKW